MAGGSLTAFLCLLSLIAPLNHDESQYFAAAELLNGRLPFVDFLYLQTPLQPFLLAPLAALSHSHSFILLRMVQGIAGAAILWLVYLCQRRLGAGWKASLSATCLLALTHSFQFGVTVVRNDALPALFASVGMLLALSAISRESRRANPLLWFGAGLAFAAAIATKISYVLPAAAIGLYFCFALARTRSRATMLDAAMCALGAALIAFPWIILRAAAPQTFDYGVFHYAVHAPFDWYRVNGLGDRLTLQSKATDIAKLFFEGPAWIALALVLSATVRRRSGVLPLASATLLLDLLILAGLLAAASPTPSWQQYLIPMLPPLFVRAGLILDDFPRWNARWRVAIGLALAASAAIGLLQPVQWITKAFAGNPNVVTATREAHWIGAQLEGAGADGAIATLSPHIVLDSGYALDPRFSAGPFFYRTGDRLLVGDQWAMHVISPKTLSAFLCERPPAAIVTGYETRHKRFKIDLDAGLRRFAVMQGYRRKLSPYGDAELYIAPQSPTPTGGCRVLA